MNRWRKSCGLNKGLTKKMLTWQSDWCRRHHEFESGRTFWLRRLDRRPMFSTMFLTGSIMVPRSKSLMSGCSIYESPYKIIHCAGTTRTQSFFDPLQSANTSSNIWSSDLVFRIDFFSCKIIIWVYPLYLIRYHICRIVNFPCYISY